MKNLAIITSVINTSPNPLNYTKTRSVYSSEDRYTQTLKSIESCKKIDNCEILFIETSDIGDEKENTIKDLVTYYINFSKNESIKGIIDGPFKGKAESTQIWFGIETINLGDYENLIKISGRYWLSDEFKYSNYDNTHNIFKEGPNALGTVMYKIHNTKFKRYIECLNYCRGSNGQLEKEFRKFFNNDYITYPKIGIEGHVSVDGKLINW